MVNVGERGFHILMGGLLLGSTMFDRLATSVLPAWNPPQVSLLTLAIGLIWVALFASYRGKNLEDRVKVLQGRLEITERRVEQHDLELAERRLP